jgi:hypothetical protein
MVIIPVNEKISYIVSIRLALAPGLRLRELWPTNVRALWPGIAAPATLGARPGWGTARLGHGQAGASRPNNEGPANDHGHPKSQATLMHGTAAAGAVENPQATMPLARNGQSSRSSASRHNRKSQRSVANAGLGGI